MKVRHALESLVNAHAHAHARACAPRGMCFRHVWATQSYVTTQHWKTAVAHGHVDATWSLARVYEKGRHSAKRSHSKAVTLYMQGAAKGDARCQHHVARAYKNGEGVQQSYTKAITEYEKSAKQGFAQSHHNLGCIYANGIKTASGKVQVKKDLDKARKHFKKGAELDCTPSWHALHALDAHMAEEKQKAQKEDEARLVAEALERRTLRQGGGKGGKGSKGGGGKDRELDEYMKANNVGGSAQLVINKVL